MTAFAGALLAVMVTLLFIDGASVLAALGIGLAVWLVLGALTDLGAEGRLRVRARRPRCCGVWPACRARCSAPTLAHLGLGADHARHRRRVMAFQTENILAMKPGETTEISGYVLRFRRTSSRSGGRTTRRSRARFALLDAAGAVLRRDRFVEALLSGRGRCRRPRPASRRSGVSQLYISLGDETADGGLVVRIWWKPLVTLIWGGALVMMAGGAVSLFDRRLRVGAPSRRRQARRRSGRRRHEARRLSCRLLCWPSPVGPARRAALLPGEVLADPALEARARALVGRTALHGLPEPVDRRCPMPNWRTTCAFWCASG